MEKLFFIFNFIFAFLSVIKVSNCSFCLETNVKLYINYPDPKLIDCYLNYEMDNSTYCCLLTIIEQEKTTSKCIEILDKENEDEIVKKIDTFKLMFKDAEEISIDCFHHYIVIKFLQIFLILFSLFL